MNGTADEAACKEYSSLLLEHELSLITKEQPQPKICSKLTTTQWPGSSQYG